MPLFKYFCPECGLVSQSESDLTDQSIKCVGCRAAFIGQPMNRPSAAEAKVVRSAGDTGLRSKTGIPHSPQSPGPRPSTVRPPDPLPAPPLDDPPAVRTRPRAAAATPMPPPPRAGVKSRPPTEPKPIDDEVIIPLHAVRNKSRWPLAIGLIVACVITAIGGLALWFYMFKGDSLKHKIEAADGAWSVRLPDKPQKSEDKDGGLAYAYTRPGRDAEYVVFVRDDGDPMTDDAIDLAAAFVPIAVVKELKVLDSEPSNLRQDPSKYDGEFPCRTFHMDTARGNLTGQLIVINWNSNKSTMILQMAVGKDISDSEREAFFKSVKIKKGQR